MLRLRLMRLMLSFMILALAPIAPIYAAQTGTVTIPRLFISGTAASNDTTLTLTLSDGTLGTAAINVNGTSTLRMSSGPSWVLTLPAGETLTTGTITLGQVTGYITMDAPVEAAAAAIPFGVTQGKGFTRYSYTTTSDGKASTTLQLSGVLTQARFVTGTQTNAYDVTLTDADGFEALVGSGANISNAAATASKVPVVTDGTKTASPRVTGSYVVAVTNGGASKAGAIILYLE